jgi:hypothetical protein
MNGKKNGKRKRKNLHSEVKKKEKEEKKILHSEVNKEGKKTNVEQKVEFYNYK